ncbi:F0F1 ATP synthase subunit delta [Albirhodobacter sp. R86504]|uniref:F0F1 ATP synthase subunit delta n=1 Tax=Albirhodobacter sp. R86504 TaxID=3093848 RepID=UPI00366E2351
MSEPASISASIAARYATAVFEISREANGLDALEKDLDALRGVVSSSSELRDLMTSPLYSRDDQSAAIGAIAAKMGLGDTLASTLRLMASNRRLFALPALVTSLQGMIADAKGEVTADVTAATELTAAQADKLAGVLAKQTGKTVKLNLAVDESLIGGMIVKLGSKMVDTSVASKLASLKNAMKEVG